VVIVEAAEQSGSLNTATHAIEQGKTVFAVPGNITNPYSQGCNKLIEQGAIPYTSPDDVIHELFPAESTQKHRRLRQNSLIGDTDTETLILVVMVYFLVADREEDDHVSDTLLIIGALVLFGL
jgi:DNA processing protein